MKGVDNVNKYVNIDSVVSKSCDQSVNEVLTHNQH